MECLALEKVAGILPVRSIRQKNQSRAILPTV
jgi:hypothetical protein